MESVDIIIVGSGIAGLSLSIQLAELRKDLSIVIFTKSDDFESNTRYAQGGIAGVFDLKQDSFQDHINDTLNAGGGLCNEEIVKKIIYSAPDRILELEKWGVDFTKNKAGVKEAVLEGGHSFPRVIHSKDQTGSEVENSLLKKIKEFPSIQMFNHFRVIELMSRKDNGKTVLDGVKVLDSISESIKVLYSKVVVLSTGGCGQIFQFTTNPKIATGDGIALAKKIGAFVKGMNFIQFHPTAFYEKDVSPMFLISEAVRGAGAYIVNQDENRFVFDYDTRGELATRDIVTKSILSELKKSNQEHVYLDCRHIDLEKFQRSFPTILAYCELKGYSISKDLIPIVPAAHYQCGGIVVDEFGETDIQNLYAIGECSNTGMHGKNRLASNSLLEALAFAHFSAHKIVKIISENPINKTIVSDQKWDNFHQKDILEIQTKLQAIMSRYAMIGSSLEELEFGLKKIVDLETEHQNLFSDTSFSIDKWSLSNSFLISKMILSESISELLKEKLDLDQKLVLR